MTAKPLVFLHVPKTAGTSMIELLSRNFAADEVLRVHNTHRAVSDLAGDIDIAIAEGKRFICGHFPYAAVAHLGDEIDLVTMLRDPVRRIASLYKFWRGRDPARAGGSASEFACRVAQALSFEEFVACTHPVIASATQDEMCKALVGHVSQAPDGLDAAERFQWARDSLGRMAFGLVDEMAASMRVLSRALRLNLLDEVHVNRTDHMPELEISEAARETILRNNQGDTMLHTHAECLFQQRVKRARIAELHRDIGDRALTSMVADDRGSHHWDASMRLSGTDWNDRESLPDGSCYRFTSAPESVIHLPNPFHGLPSTLTVEVAFFNQAGMLDCGGAVPPSESLGFEVNGARVTASARRLGEAGEVFTVPIDRAMGNAPFLTVALKSRYGISPSVFGSPDQRNLAAAVRSMRLSP